MTISIAEERADSADAIALIVELDAHLGERYAVESRHGFSVEKLLRDGVAFFVIREDGLPAGCGGLLFVGDDYAELKRMYVRPAHRGRGLGRRMLEHLERLARERNVGCLRLETGVLQLEALSLYERAGFRQIAPFGPYRVDPVSRCYEKHIAPSNQFDLSIRNASPNQTKLISEVLCEAASWLIERGDGNWRLEDLAPERVAPQVEAGLFYIGWVGDDAAAVIRFELEDLVYWPEASPGEAAYVHRFAVRRRYAGGGVSRAMLNWAADHARSLGLPRLRLDCAAHRPALRGVYEKFGFRFHSERAMPNYTAARYELNLADADAS
jgi:GNAT superfamily N-acetyltransferase